MIEINKMPATTRKIVGKIHGQLELLFFVFGSFHFQVIISKYRWKLGRILTILRHQLPRAQYWATVIKIAFEIESIYEPVKLWISFSYSFIQNIHFLSWTGVLNFFSLRSYALKKISNIWNFIWKLLKLLHYE